MEEKQEQNVKIHYDDVMMTSSRTSLYLTLFRLGGGGGKCPPRFQLSRTSLMFKQYLPNVSTFTKTDWRIKFCKNFASRVSHVAMAK